jgi:archaellum component FlaC
MQDTEKQIDMLQKMLNGVSLKLDQLRANMDELGKGNIDLMEEIVEELEEEYNGVEVTLEEMADNSSDSLGEDLQWAKEDIEELEERIDKYLEPLDAL